MLSIIQEDEVLDMLAQYESDETLLDGSVRRGGGPPPLTAMPCSTSDEPHRDHHAGLYISSMKLALLYLTMTSVPIPSVLRTEILQIIVLKMS